MAVAATRDVIAEMIEHDRADAQTARPHADRHRSSLFVATGSEPPHNFRHPQSPPRTAAMRSRHRRVDDLSSRLVVTSVPLAFASIQRARSTHQRVHGSFSMHATPSTCSPRLFLYSRGDISHLQMQLQYYNGTGMLTRPCGTSPRPKCQGKVLSKN